MKVLITGGTGTISSGLVYESVRRGFDTYAITRGSNNSRNITGAEYIHADIWNTDSINSQLGNLKVDIVVECLAYNIEQLKISLENFSKRCVQYVFISTAAVYNRVGNTRIRENDTKEFFDWSYTREKIECEKFLKDYSAKTGLRYTIIRPTVTYGNYRIPFPIATRTPGWTFFDRMKRGQLMLASDNVQFSVIHISDFAKMVVSLFGNEDAINEDFHITSNDNDIYWDDVLKISGEILNVTPQIVHVPVEVIKKIWPQIYDELAFHKNTVQIFDDSKIKAASKVKACVDIRTGMKKTISEMEKDYNEKDLRLDRKWEEHCDAVIFYAYINNQLSEEDSLIVKQYIDTFGKGDFERSLKKVKQGNKRFLMHICKQKIVRFVKEIYGRGE